MSEEIIKVLDNLGQKFGIVIDWTSQNVMPYLQDLLGRFISLKNAEAITWIVISALVILGSIIVIIATRKWTKRNKFNSYDDEMFIAFLLYWIMGFLIFISIVVLLSNIFGLMQNIFVPEVTVLKYIQNNL